jgi:hypothetical protein
MSADTVTPLAQFAATFPAIDELVCAVMFHFTSEQLPSGRPAMLDEPQAPANADAAPELEPPDVAVTAVDDAPPVDDPLVVDPVAPPVSDGAVGVKSFEVCSNEQPVASIEASSKLKKKVCFIVAPLRFCIRTHSSGV